ncbi:MAG: extracellular solute-binding protein [Zavarzinia sp.]|nr:extracellular solute-binding protein [Zavarzinia sp.]
MPKTTRLAPSRRAVLAGGLAGAALAGFGFPSIVRAADKSLKVGVYGGYFKDSFDQHIFPEFTKATGIAIESVAEPTGEAWLVQLEQAARAKQAPADVSMISQTSMLKGASVELWAPLNEAKIPGAKNVHAHLQNRYADGRLMGVGAVAWYITLVSNTEVFPEAPTSWAEFWDPKHKDQLGLLALVSNSFLLEVTSTTFFDGTAILDTEDGILKVMDKIAELKPNVKLWYRDEAQFEQALKSGEIPMGQYYHDVTGLAAADGHPVRSTFPKEGGITDSGSWAVSKASEKLDLAEVFIEYMCQPAIQAQLSRKVGTAPTIDRKLTDLTDAEFAAVSSDIPPIVPRYDLYQEKADWLSQKWTELIVG